MVCNDYQLRFPSPPRKAFFTILLGPFLGGAYTNFTTRDPFRVVQAA